MGSGVQRKQGIFKKLTTTNKIKRKNMTGLLVGLLLAGLLVGCGNKTINTTSADNTATDTAATDTAATDTVANQDTATALKYKVSYDGIATKAVGAKASVHDPSIIKVGDTFYLFGSHMEAASSTNLRQWKSFATGVNASNPLFTNLFTDEDVFAFAGDNGGGSYSVWAPDVIYNKVMKKYVMYFCTSSTFIKSNLCYATADSVDGPYTWQGTLLYSGFTSDTISETDVVKIVGEENADTYLKGDEYNNNLWPNCIDPTVFYDADGKMWMVYGSWSGGIFLLEVDETTGKIIHPEEDKDNSIDAYFGKRLMGGNHHSIEGPYILYDAASSYYYLFVSYGSLTREGGYQIRVFRSKTVDGEYVDTTGSNPGTDRFHYKYGLKLMGNYYLPSLTAAYMAPGHNSAMIDQDDGKLYIAYHTRFDAGTEYHEPRVHQMFINELGWPVVAPYAYDGETISITGYDKKDVTGMYYLVNHGDGIDATINEPVMIELLEDGTIVGDQFMGTWTMTDNSYYMTLTYGDVTYSGVFLKMNDEAETPVMTFTAAGTNNKSIWGVKY